jgi:muconolactone delta-isomerase
MTEQNEAQFMIQAANKDKSYQERQQARKELKDLLTRFNSDDLVYMIMNVEDNKELVSFLVRIQVLSYLKLLRI